MAPKSVTFRRHDHLVSVLFGDLLSHSYNITFSMFLYLVTNTILLLYLQSTLSSSPSLEVTQFHYTTWPDHGVPSDGMSLVYFTRAVRNAHPLSDPKPLLVHCSAGVGRTGTFIVLDTMLEQNGMVHIYGCVNHIRKQRVLLVQTLVRN